MNYLKSQVLRTFKTLHRTRMKVFAGDTKAVNTARIRINEEFKKNKHVNNEDSIKALIKLGEDVEKELRTRVIQAKEIKPYVFELKITEDTVKLDNVAFDENAILTELDEKSSCHYKNKRK